MRTNKMEENQQLMEKKFLTYVKNLEIELKNKTKQNQLLKQEINKEALQLIEVTRDIQIIDDFLMKEAKNKQSCMIMVKGKKGTDKIQQRKLIQPKINKPLNNRLKV